MNPGCLCILRLATNLAEARKFVSQKNSPQTGHQKGNSDHLFTGRFSQCDLFSFAYSVYY